MIKLTTHEERFAIIEAENKELREMVAIQIKIIAELKAEVARLRTPKNSGNSSLPPSSDFSPPKRNQSLREKSDKKSGGQLGHKGYTIPIVENPDEIIPYHPCCCEICNKDLSDVLSVLIEKRQLVDIPPVKPVVTEYQVYGRKCSCGHLTKSSFPDHVKAPVQYGASVETTVAYMHSRQYMPSKRMVEYFENIMGLHLSEGSIYNFIKRFKEKALPFYEEIKERVLQATCLGSDETSCKVNGKKHWFWAWQNELLTLIVHSENRGCRTIDYNFPRGLPNAILVSDRLAAQLQTTAKNHQICTVHIQRELEFFRQLYECRWAIDFRKLLKDANKLKKDMTPSQYFLPNERRNELETKLKQLLCQQLPAQNQKALTLQKQLNKIPEYILCFLHHADVPSHNNGSEKAIRNVKVKQKVSGQFKTDAGANAFAIIRSIIDTAIKSGKDVYKELFTIAINKHMVNSS